ncbi:hypothetical protein BDQ17DRAFT_370939 [Cyathus striatus]|nr:hypothetical protein BDQ17DRAFT_370939 [Cyathus striatus]
MKLLASTQASVPHPWQNFKHVNWDKFWEALQGQLSSLTQPAEFTSMEEFDQGLNAFQLAVSQTITDKVPLVQLSPYTKRWWSNRLAELKQNKVRLAHRAYCLQQQPAHSCHEEAWVASQLYASHLDEAKDWKWIEYLESLTDSTIWEAGGMVTAPGTDSGRAHIPNLVKHDPATR